METIAPCGGRSTSPRPGSSRLRCVLRGVTPSRWPTTAQSPEIFQGLERQRSSGRRTTHWSPSSPRRDRTPARRHRSAATAGSLPVPPSTAATTKPSTGRRHNARVTQPGEYGHVSIFALSSRAMAASLPPELARLLASSDDISREKAWSAFLDTFSPLILHAARSASAGYDEGMDLYASALDGLRADDLRKLRGYAVDPTSKFSTWLVVVVRRLCIDRQREKFGRTSRKERESGEISDERTARRRLASLASANLELETIPDSQGDPAEQALRSEAMNILDAAVGELEERDRLLLTLRFVDDLSARQIADVQGWPDQMVVYRRINQLMALLRQKLTARGLDSPVS